MKWERGSTCGAVPVPERLTVWVAGLALSMTVIDPPREPAGRRRKAMLMAQLAPAAKARAASIGLGEVAARSYAGYGKRRARLCW